MAKYLANTTIGYAHGKEMIPAKAVFDPASLEISETVVAQMLSGKLITIAADSEPVTFGPKEAESQLPTSQPSKRPNAPDAIKAVEAVETLEALNALAEGEERVTVVAAIEKKRKELTPAE